MAVQASIIKESIQSGASYVIDYGEPNRIKDLFDKLEEISNQEGVPEKPMFKYKHIIGRSEVSSFLTDKSIEE